MLPPRSTLRSISKISPSPNAVVAVIRLGAPNTLGPVDLVTAKFGFSSIKKISDKRSIMPHSSKQTKYANAKELQGLTLGQATQYSHDYDASLLQPVPRSLNRDDLGLNDSSELPFVGGDIWTLYELSWLNNKGLPQVAIGDVILPPTSPNLIESKSFKLYLNSFNQTRFESWQQVEQIIAQDLSNCAGEHVEVILRPLSHYTQQPIATMQGRCIDEQDIEITDYQFDESYLEGSTTPQEVSESLHSHLLKSNCLITNQPDWGSVVIRIHRQQN